MTVPSVAWSSAIQDSLQSSGGVAAAIVLVIVTCTATAALTSISLAKPGTRFLILIVGTPVLGVYNLIVSLMIAGLLGCPPALHPNNNRKIPGEAVTALGAAILVFMIALGLLLCVTFTACREHAHDAGDVAQCQAGRWLLLVSLVSAIRGSADGALGQTFVPLAVVGCALGAAFILDATRRCAARAAWLMRVRRNEERGWSLVSSRGRPAGVDLLPFATGIAAGNDVLMEDGDPACAGPYREVRLARAWI